MPEHITSHAHRRRGNVPKQIDEYVGA